MKSECSNKLWSIFQSPKMTQMLKLKSIPHQIMSMIHTDYLWCQSFRQTWIPNSWILWNSVKMAPPIKTFKTNIYKTLILRISMCLTITTYILLAWTKKNLSKICSITNNNTKTLMCLYKMTVNHSKIILRIKLTEIKYRTETSLGKECRIFWKMWTESLSQNPKKKTIILLLL